MDMLATPARALHVWNPPGASAWPSPPPRADASVRTSGDDDDDGEEMDEEDTADESNGSAHDVDEHLSVKEEAAQHALRAMASAAHDGGRHPPGASPRLLRTRSAPVSERQQLAAKMDAPAEEEAKPKKKRQFKKRKPTHTVRKEEKQALLTQLEVLQAKLDDLKFQALVEKGETAKSVARQQNANMVLRESIEEHHVAFARVQSLLSGYMVRLLCSCSSSPLRH